MQALKAAYQMAVSEYSDEDVASAVAAYIQGKVPWQSMEFAPKPPQLASACRRAMEARLDDENRRNAAIRQIEAREGIEKTPESRKRVKAQVDELVARLSVADNFSPNRSDLLERAKANHDRYFSVGDPDGNEDSGEAA